MSNSPPRSQDAKGEKPDRDRSGAALRANLQRRKAQARGRAAAAAAEPDDAAATPGADRVLKSDGLG